MAANLKEITLSPTKIDTFYKCQRKYYYSYVNQPYPPAEHNYFIMGNIAHKALDIFHRSHFITGLWPKGMSVSFREAVAAESAFKKIEQGHLTKEDLFSVKEMLKNYLTFLRSGTAVNVVQLEKLAFVKISNVPVWLKADRVDRVSDGYTVIDYKTSKNPATKKAEIESVQIPTYGIWLKSAFKADNANLYGMYYYLRHIGSKKGVHQHTIDQNWMNDTADKYRCAYQQIINGCKFSKTTDVKSCRWCDFRLACSNNFGLS
jgi:RecB family exonuclease